MAIALTDLARLDPSTERHGKAVEDAIYQLEDAAREIRTYRDGIERSLPLGTLSTLTFSAVVVPGSDTSPVSRWDIVSDLHSHLRTAWGSIEEMVRDYSFPQSEAQRYLIRLDRLKVIELQPGNRTRLLISRQLSWRAGGPVQKFLHQTLLREFLDSQFAGPQEHFFFNGGEERLGESPVRAGYAVLAPDAYWHGDRAGTGPSGTAPSGRSEQDDLFKLNLWLGRTLWGMFVRDDRVALDYLCTRPEVDASRIGATGMSMGSSRAWWLAVAVVSVSAVAHLAKGLDVEEAS